MRNVKARLGAVLVAVMSAMSAVGAPAAAATGELAASCEIFLTTNGTRDPAFTVRGSYKLLGSIPATVPSTAPLTADDWGIYTRLDWDVLGPELAARGVTKFDQAMVLGAYLAVNYDGVEDWPQNLNSSTFDRDIPIDRLATGLTSHVADTQMYPGNALPGHWKFASYGDIWLVFHKLDNPQTTMIVHCAADPGQDLTWGETVVTP
jgi:hypothetical protein